MLRHPEQSITIPQQCQTRDEFLERAASSTNPISLKVVTRPFYLEHGSKRGTRTIIGQSYVLVHRLYAGNEQGKSHVEAYYPEWLCSTKLNHGIYSGEENGITSRITARNKALLQIPEKLRELRKVYPERNIYAVGEQEALADYIENVGGRMLVDFSLEEKGCAIHDKTPRRLVAPPVDDSPTLTEIPTGIEVPVGIETEKLLAEALDRNVFEINVLNGLLHK
jgi:hypothetical protein